MIDLKEVREIVNKHVSIAVGEIEEAEPRITLAVRGKLVFDDRESWRVNVSYSPKRDKSSGFKWGRTASFKIDPETGDVIEFEEGRSWNY
jgi:hypothetical protein